MATKQILTIIADRQKHEEISTSNKNLIFKQDSKIVSKIPISKIILLVIVGDVSITTPLLKELSDSGINITFCTYNFELTYNLNCQSYTNSSLKLNQFNIIQTPASKLVVAKHIIKNKIINQLGKNQSEAINLQLQSVTNNQQLMGVEGSYSAKYFGELFANMNWKSRQPRAKSDIANFLLDIGYTYLFNYVNSLSSQLGWETTFGFLHADYYQRQSLICDLMEPIRPIIDKSIIKAWNLGKIKIDDFEIFENKTRLIDYKKTSKYTTIFLDTIVDNQQGIWKYLSDFTAAINHLEIDNLPEFLC